MAGQVEAHGHGPRRPRACLRLAAASSAAERKTAAENLAAHHEHVPAWEEPIAKPKAGGKMGSVVEGEHSTAVAIDLQSKKVVWAGTSCEGTAATREDEFVALMMAYFQSKQVDVPAICVDMCGSAATIIAALKRRCPAR